MPIQNLKHLNLCPSLNFNSTSHKTVNKQTNRKRIKWSDLSSEEDCSTDSGSDSDDGGFHDWSKRRELSNVSQRNVAAQPTAPPSYDSIAIDMNQ